MQPARGNDADWLVRLLRVCFVLSLVAADNEIVWSRYGSLMFWLTELKISDMDEWIDSDGDSDDSDSSDEKKDREEKDEKDKKKKTKKGL